MANVSTYHYDNARSGWNANEVALLPNVVGGPTFGKLFSYVLDGVCFAQPLYAAQLSIGGANHNVVFAATEAGSVYAFDADVFNAGAQPWLWRRSLVGGKEIASPDGALKATPVIDDSAGIMYVIGRFQDLNVPANMYFRLHAIDIETGLDVAAVAPVRIDAASVPHVQGLGQPQAAQANGQISFDPSQHRNRPALLFANSTVYAAFGSTGDNPPYHGWVMAFRPSDLALLDVFCTTPDAAGTWVVDSSNHAAYSDPNLGGGIWQAGFGLAADGEGFIYCVTANGLFGSFEGNVARNYAESMLKLDPTLTLVGSFTPPNPLALTTQDLDFGSGGPLVLPDGAGGGKYVVGCGKDANVYLLDRTQLNAATLGEVGNYRSTTRLASNRSAAPPNEGGGPGVWGGPAFYGDPLGNVLYYCGGSGPLQALVLSMNDAINHNWQLQPGGAWSGQVALGGTAKQLTVGINASGTLEVFWVGTDDKLYHDWQLTPGGAWHGQAALGGTARRVAVAMNKSGTLEIFSIGTDSQLYHNWQTTPGGTWNGQVALGNAARDLCVARNKSGTLEVFYVGADDNIYHTWQTTPGGVWHGQAPLSSSTALRSDGYTVTGAAQQLTVAVNASGTLEAFYVGSDYKLYHTWQLTPGGNWSGETALGGSALQVTAAVNKSGTLEVFSIGPDSAIYHNWQTSPGGAWHGEAALGGSAKYVAAGVNRNGTLEVFYVGLDDKIYHNWQTSPGGTWHGGALLGGSAQQIAVAQNQSGTLEIFYVDGDLTQAVTAALAANATASTEQFPNEGGAIPVVSSNGVTAGTAVVWLIARPGEDNSIHLRAYDAADLTKGNIFDAAVGAWSNPDVGAFLAPMVINGKVYVASDALLSVYGVQPVPPPPALDCAALAASIDRLGAPGVRMTLAELATWKEQLLTCAANGSISRAKYEELLAIIAAYVPGGTP